MLGRRYDDHAHVRPVERYVRRNSDSNTHRSTDLCDPIRCQNGAECTQQAGEHIEHGLVDDEVEVDDDGDG